ncbi:hypothetical protein KUTeg_010317 [Tegillarca granosa]|uniref:Uncharacterized protein n=1 Tax=Tegillarca granosa TaxID=220873 RepID=A0ABQ9F6J1_TEGGR|nr:hypothetical protein KUTeg_010317 [Tegillarca granosa]
MHCFTKCYVSMVTDSTRSLEIKAVFTTYIAYFKADVIEASFCPSRDRRCVKYERKCLNEVEEEDIQGKWILERSEKTDYISVSPYQLEWPDIGNFKCLEIKNDSKYANTYHLTLKIYKSFYFGMYIINVSSIFICNKKN